MERQKKREDREKVFGIGTTCWTEYDGAAFRRGRELVKRERLQGRPTWNGLGLEMIWSVMTIR